MKGDSRVMFVTTFNTEPLIMVLCYALRYEVSLHSTDNIDGSSPELRQFSVDYNDRRTKEHFNWNDKATKLDPMSVLLKNICLQ